MVGAYNNNLITAFQVGKAGDGFTERYIEIRSESVVVATGCIERPLLFDHNERPGVMQVGCAHRMARTYGLLPGSEAVFSVGHDLGLEAAVDLFDLGLKINCVADIREDGQNPELMLALAERKIPVLKGWVAATAHGAKQVEKVTLTTVEGTVKRDFSCDLLVASAGLTPVVGPFILAQAKMGYDSRTGYFLPTELPAKMFPAGRITGVNHAGSIEASGRLAGLKAAAAAGANMDEAVTVAEQAVSALPGPDRGCKLVTAPVKGRKSFICFDEDATVKSVKQAIDKGFDVPELVKRFAGVGLGPGQGGIPGHNLPLFVAKYTASINTPVPTTVRPPLVPTFLATYAGYNHHMFKRTPLHDSQKADGGIFRNIGVWQRARYFSEDFDCKEEILNVRNNVGMLDGSTLGKFRIHGPDALKALQRVYVSDMSKVKEGRIKYSAMCNDDGCVIDDGVVVKLGENDYYFTTSSGRAGQTVEWIRYHTRFDGWDFSTGQPDRRHGCDQPLRSQCPQGAGQGGGHRPFQRRLSLFRLPGVLDQRHHFRARHAPGIRGRTVPTSCTFPPPTCRRSGICSKTAGAEFGIRNFGVEAQNVLRMEKCHIILGSGVRTAHQPAGPGPGLSLGPQKSRCQDRWCRGPAPG
jgi:sarcosine oxidase subunit alpha